MKIKRAGFIDRSTSVRETFSFADPKQVIRAVEIHCGDHYGSMTWDLYGDAAGKYYRCWNTCVKLVWNCPRSTHTFLVNGLLARDRCSMRTQILSRYVKFTRSLLNSASPEVVSVANKAMRDRGLNPYRNQCSQDTGGNRAQHLGHDPWQSQGCPD